MSGYRCFLFDASKLVGAREYADKSTAQTSVKFGLQWGPFDRAEIWDGHQRIEAWTKTETEEDESS